MEENRVIPFLPPNWSRVRWNILIASINSAHCLVIEFHRLRARNRFCDVLLPKIPFHGRQRLSTRCRGSDMNCLVYLSKMWVAPLTIDRAWNWNGDWNIAIKLKFYSSLNKLHDPSSPTRWCHLEHLEFCSFWLFQWLLLVVNYPRPPTKKLK